MTLTSRWLIAFALLSCACSRVAATTEKHPDGYETLELRYEGNPGYVSIHELAEDLGYLAPIKLNYVGANASGGPHSIQAVVSGDLDIGSSFNGAIVKLIASKAPLTAVVASYGTDAVNYQATYVLEDSPIHKASDLIGKQVSMNTLGAHAEFALREWLARSGVSNDKAKQVSMIALPAINGEQALRQKQVDAAILGQIYREKAVARGGIRKLISDYDMFGPLTAGAVVMSNRFIEKNPNTVRKYVSAIGQAFEWLQTHTDAEAVERFVRIIRARKRNENTDAVQHWTGNGVSAQHGRLEDRDFQIWIDWLARDGQIAPGQIKASDVYTNAFQPDVATP